MEEPPPLKTRIVTEPAQNTDTSNTATDATDATATADINNTASGEKAVDDMNNEELDQELEKVRSKASYHL
jgi:hypothetical protein